VEHTGNSEVTALVTGDPVKASALAKKYGAAARTYSYEYFRDMLSSGFVDAIDLATPNWRHTEFAVPALEAGTVGGGWGRMGATRIRLAAATEDVLAGALHTAWKLRVERNGKAGKSKRAPTPKAKKKPRKKS
jgi:hypothetical protein